MLQLSLLYPIYDRFRRVGGVKWRLVSFAGSLAGALLTLLALWGRLPALGLLADYALPLLVSLATVLEILAFVFIYGNCCICFKCRSSLCPDAGQQDS